MAAGITTSTQAGFGSVLFEDLIRKKMNLKVNGPLHPHGNLFAFTTGAIAVPTTAIDDVNDYCLLVKLPKRYGAIYIHSISATFTDMDSHATPTLVNDVITHDGTTTVNTYISGTTAGQASGTKSMAADLLAPMHTDESGNYIAIKTTTVSATPVAGTVTIRGLIWVGDRIVLS